MSKWYNSNGYRWISLSLAMACVASILAFAIIDIITRKCNDSYHNIDACLNSTTCDIRYCEPSACPEYTCLPRLSDTCMQNDMIYYTNGECPRHKGYKTSLVMIILSSILAADLMLFIVTVIHDKCTQTYAELYLDDEIADRLIKGNNVHKKKCMQCRGAIDGCSKCNGSGVIIDKYSDIDDFY